jgi:hypothetical protein
LSSASASALASGAPAFAPAVGATCKLNFKGTRTDKMLELENLVNTFDKEGNPEYCVSTLKKIMDVMIDIYFKLDLSKRDWDLNELLREINDSTYNHDETNKTKIIKYIEAICTATTFKDMHDVFIDEYNKDPLIVAESSVTGIGMRLFSPTARAPAPIPVVASSAAFTSAPAPAPAAPLSQANLLTLITKLGEAIKNYTDGSGIDRVINIGHNKLRLVTYVSNYESMSQDKINKIKDIVDMLNTVLESDPVNLLDVRKIYDNELYFNITEYYDFYNAVKNWKDDDNISIMNNNVIHIRMYIRSTMSNKNRYMSSDIKLIEANKSDFTTKLKDIVGEASIKVTDNTKLTHLTELLIDFGFIKRIDTVASTAVPEISIPPPSDRRLLSAPVHVRRDSTADDAAASVVPAPVVPAPAPVVAVVAAAPAGLSLSPSPFIPAAPVVPAPVAAAPAPVAAAPVTAITVADGTAPVTTAAADPVVPVAAAAPAVAAAAPAVAAAAPAVAAAAPAVAAPAPADPASVASAFAPARSYVAAVVASASASASKTNPVVTNTIYNYKAFCDALDSIYNYETGQNTSIFYDKISIIAIYLGNKGVLGDYIETTEDKKPDITISIISEIKQELKKMNNTKFTCPVSSNKDTIKNLRDILIKYGVYRDNSLSSGGFGIHKYRHVQQKYKAKRLKIVEKLLKKADII